MAYNTNNPEVRFAGYTEDWIESELHEVANLLTGNPFESKKFLDNGYFLVRGMNVKRGYIDTSKSVSRFWPTSEGLNVYLLEEGDILVQMDGALIGQSYAKVEKKHLPALLVQRVTRIRGGSTVNELVYQYLKKDFYNYIRSIKTETAVPHLSLADIARFTFSIPKNPTEQTQIGNFLKNLDLIIYQHQQKHSKLEILKNLMLDKMFPKNGANVPEIRFKDFDEDWEKKELGKIGRPYTGLSGKTKKDFGHGEARYITYMNVFSNPVADIELIEAIEIDDTQNVVLDGDVLFSTSSETAEEVGMSSVWTYDKENVYLNSFCFGYRPNIKIHNYFLANLLRSPGFRKTITFLAQGISRYNISKNKVMELNIFLPSYNEQEKIGTYFKNVENLICNHQEQIIKLKNLKKACLAKMLI